MLIFFDDTLSSGLRYSETDFPSSGGHGNVKKTNKHEFHKKKLKSYAGSTIYNRGKEYYNDNAVREIKIENGKYTAYVYGNERYTVKYNPENNIFSCNCPYDDFCKHSVAFGLKLLDEEENLDKNVKSFGEFYSGVDNELKLKFLQKVLSENSKLEDDFQKFIKIETNQFDKVEIRAVANDLFNKINSYDHEDIYDETPHSYYRDSWEIAGDILDGILSDYEEELKRFTDSRKFNDGFKYLCGINLALIESEDTVLAEHAGDIDGYAYTAKEIFENAIKTADIAEKKQIISLLFHEVENYKELANWHLHQSLLDVFFEEKELAEIIKEKLNKYSSDELTLSIFRKIEKRLGNTDALKKLAQNNPDDYKLAIEPQLFINLIFSLRQACFLFRANFFSD